MRHVRFEPGLCQAFWRRRAITRFGASFLISFFLLSGGNRSFVLFFFHLVVRCGIEGAEFYPAMQDKTRITPVLARVLWVAPASPVCCDIVTAKSCAFLWKGEKSKREQDEKDEWTRHCFLCAEADSDLEVCKPLSESVRCAVKTQQQVLKTVCKMYCVCKMQGVGRTNTRLVHIFAAAFDWRILPPYQYTLA